MERDAGSWWSLEASSWSVMEFQGVVVAIVMIIIKNIIIIII